MKMSLNGLRDPDIKDDQFSDDTVYKHKQKSEI